MKTQTDTVYHCVSCGRVVNADSETAAPHCCGQAMAIAVPATTTENAVVGEKTLEVPQTPRTIEACQKPR